MANIDPQKIREEAAKKKQEVVAVTGDIVAPAATTGGKPNEQTPAQEAPNR